MANEQRHASVLMLVVNRGRQRAKRVIQRRRLQTERRSTGGQYMWAMLTTRAHQRSCSCTSRAAGL